MSLRKFFQDKLLVLALRTLAILFAFVNFTRVRTFQITLKIMLLLLPEAHDLEACNLQVFSMEQS